MLASNRPKGVDRTIGASLATLILLGMVLWAPLLGVRDYGFSYDVTLIQAAEAMARGGLPLIGLFVGVTALLLPVFRALAQIYALLPPRLGRKPAPGAVLAFRMAGEVREWAMLEVFLIAIGVSMFKMHGLANVILEPAFFALGATVMAIIFEARGECRDTAWRMITGRPEWSA